MPLHFDAKKGEEFAFAQISLKKFMFLANSQQGESDKITHNLWGMQAGVQWGWAHLHVQGGMVQSGSLGRMDGFQKGVPAAGVC